MTTLQMILPALRNNKTKQASERISVVRGNLNRLSSTSEIWSIPYRVYYMSCNLDHVLYGKMNSTDEEKKNDAFSFAKKYRDNIPGFINYISNSDFSVVDSYPQSWQYIREGLHSLERHTNFGLCFK